MSVVNRNILDSSAEAIILTIDGAKKGMEGNIARAFAKKYPNAWELLEYEITYPIPIGMAKIFNIEDDDDCNQKFCIIASTLHHLDVLEQSSKRNIINSALRYALTQANNHQLKSLCTTTVSYTHLIAEVDDYGNLTESQLGKAYLITETITSSELPGGALGKQPATSKIKKESSQEAQNTKNELLAKVNYLYLEMKKKANEFINTIGIASETTKTVESKIQGNVAGNKTDLQNPPKNYLDWGACPFECCVYREWVAKEPVKIYQDREESSPVVATLNMNESVNALTGVVVTQKVGRAKILMPITVWKNSKSISPSEVTIKKGAIVYPLHYEGEGYSAFWYKGQIYSGELVDAKKVNIEQMNQYDWWAQIKTKNGEIGWTKRCV